MEAARERVGWNLDVTLGDWGGDHHAKADAAGNDAANPQVQSKQSWGARLDARSCLSGEQKGPVGEKPLELRTPLEAPHPSHVHNSNAFGQEKQPAQGADETLAWAQQREVAKLGGIWRPRGRRMAGIATLP